MSGLTTIYMASNNLSGSIPASIGTLTNLRYLNLARNELRRPPPSQLGDLSNLRVLYLTGNGLSGSIPASLGNLTNLTSLHLNLNELTGEFPIELEKLVKLEELRLADNELTGCVPGSLSCVSKHDIAQLGLPYCRAKPIFRTSESGLRSISEGATVGTAVGRPVAAVDRDGDRLTYSLGGTDTGTFEINSASGQLTLAEALDYEEQTTHSVAVSVHDGTDSEGQSDTSVDRTIEVTIEVLDVDETPTVTGTTSYTVNENSNPYVGRFTALDPEGNSIRWSVRGTDTGAFEIDEYGALRFESRPDFEMPTDRGRDNEYEVSVQASDGSNTASIVVTVTVLG